MSTRQISNKQTTNDHNLREPYSSHPYQSTYTPRSIYTTHILQKRGVRTPDLIDKHLRSTRGFLSPGPTTNDIWHAPYVLNDRQNEAPMIRLQSLHPAHPSSRILDSKH